jgi:hypothetical protein
MSWSATWSQTSFTNNDVKFLLADLCNAINERLNIFSTKVNFNIYGGTSQSPTSSSFVGMPVTGGASTWSGVCNQIDSAIDTLFPSTTNWWDSSFTSRYTRSGILSAIGYTESDISSINWRSPNFYKGIKAMLPYARYATTNASGDNISLDSYSSTAYTPGIASNNSSDAWGDTSTLSFTKSGIFGRINGYITYISFVGYPFYQAIKTSDNVTLSLSVSGNYTLGTRLKYSARIQAQSITYADYIIPIDISGDFAGNSWTSDLSSSSSWNSSYFDFTTSSPELNVDMTSIPFTIDEDFVTDFYPTAGLVDYGEFTISVGPVVAYYDMNSAYSYT